MNDEELFKRIDEVLDGHDDVPVSAQRQKEIELSIAAYQRRFDHALRDLGLDLSVDVRSLYGHPYNVVVRFPSLERKKADALLNRLEDIAIALEKKSDEPVKVHPGQMTLF